MAPFDTTGKKVALALALASGATAPKAAEQAQVSLRTVRRKLANPAFRRLVSRLRGDMLAAALGRMAENMTRAADTVAGLLDEENAAIRLRAARTMLSLGLRLRDSVDLGERVRELERELAQKQGVTP